MDQAFLLRARRLLEQRPLERLTHAELKSAAASQQDASPTARMATRCDAQAAGAVGEAHALAALLLGDGTHVPESANLLCACFSRAVAIRQVNTR